MHIDTEWIVFSDDRDELRGWNFHPHHTQNGADCVGGDCSLFVGIERFETHFQLCKVENKKEKKKKIWNFVNFKSFERKIYLIILFFLSSSKIIYSRAI